MTVLTPLYLQKKAIPARFDRQLLGDIFRKGVIAAGDLAVIPNGGTTVSIAKGVGYIPGTLQIDQGVYRLFNDAPFSLALDAAVTNPRMDTLVMRVQDSNENSNIGPDQGSLEYVKGTESATVTRANRAGGVLDAALPANTVPLADVIVRPGQAIVAADITDRRTLAFVKADFGDIKFAMSTTASLGWKVAGGAALERIMFPDLLGKLTFGRAGNTVNASVTVSGLSSTADLFQGMGVTGPGVPVGTFIQTIVNSTSITLSKNATASATAAPLTFYLGASPAFTRTGTTASANSTITGLSRTDDLYIGMPVSGTGVPAGAYIQSIVSTTSVTISANATAAGSPSLTFTPHGAGDAVSTFNIPDMRGQGAIGAGQASALTNRVLGISGGEEAHQLIQTELASHDHGGVTGSMNRSNPHSHNQKFSGATSAPDGAVQMNANLQNFGYTATETADINHEHMISNTGSNVAHNTMQPFRSLTPLIYTGVPF